jgi:predicted DNA-binding transcriptional regulator AlpA
MIKQADLRKWLGVSRKTFLAWRKAGKIPPPDVQLSLRCVGWKESTLREAGINV